MNKHLIKNKKVPIFYEINYWYFLFLHPFYGITNTLLITALLP